MTDQVTLLGTEAITQAGNQIASAAQEMQRAAAYIDDTFQRHQRFMDEWLERFTKQLTIHEKELNR